MQAPGAEDPETVKKLASFGYIGMASPAADRKDLPDPKDRITTIDRLKDSARLVSQHRDDEAAALLANLTAENPLMLDGWETLARVLRRAGRTKEALAALEQADRLTARHAAAHSRPGGTEPRDRRPRQSPVARRSRRGRGGSGR